MTQYVLGGPPRYDHQKRGLRKMIETGGVAALLFDPGTGKTAPTLDYMGLLALKKPPAPDGTREVRVLVVCPLAAVDTWVTQAETYMSPMVNFWAEALGGGLLVKAEALAARGGRPFTTSTRKRQGEKQWVPRSDPKAAPRALHYRKAWAFASEPPVPHEAGPDALGCEKPRVVISVVNIDALSSRSKVGGRTMADVMLDAVTRYAPDLLVVDESHKIKSAQGNASRLLARIGRHVKRRIVLTGTVIPHSPLDVFGQWRFLDPFAFGGPGREMTIAGFKERYAVMGGYMGYEVTGFNLDEMQSIMAINASVARKEDALDLPPTTDVIVPVHLSNAEAKVYADLKANLAVQLAPGVTATVPNRLTQLLRLRQVTSGHLPDDAGVNRVIGSARVDTIASLVHDTLVGEKRIVIFAYFTHEMAELRAAIERPGTEVLGIGGGTKQNERLAMRKRFGSTDPARIVMIAQVRTMSLAVNELVTASHAIFASLSQQRDDLVQARDRLDRIGQTKPCTFWYALAPGTVDEVIYRTHQNRDDLEAAMLRHVLDQEGSP